MSAVAVDDAIASVVAPAWYREERRSNLPSVAVSADGEHRPSRPSRPTSDRATDRAHDESAVLVERARDGERAAFRQLFDRHRHDVARLVFRMLGPRADVDDLVQEVFVQVHKSLRDFRGDARFSTWLHRVTVNVVLMHKRAARSRPTLDEELPAGTVEDPGSTMPDDEVDRRKRVAAFFDLLSTIAEKKRVVFSLHDLEGLSPQEISAIVGAPVLTVRTRLFYARREMEAGMRAHPALARVIDELGGFAGAESGQRRKP